jgi:HlyD family secretion protein
MTITADFASDTHGRRRLGPACGMRGRVVWGLLFAVLLVGGIGGWAVTASLSGAVIGGGTIIVTEDVKVVQHIDGGVVREIAVSEGDHVTTGQVLLRLDDVQIRAERGIVIAQLTELRAREARLLAERNSATDFAFSDNLLARFPDMARIAEGEAQVFDNNIQSRRTQIEQIEMQIAQMGEEVSGLTFQRDSVVEELALAEDELKRFNTLSESRLVEQNRITALARDIARLNGKSGEINASIARIGSRVSELELQILNVEIGARTTAQRELRIVEAQISELEERLLAVNERVGRVEIRAPVSGIVNELAVTTLGGVISPAERLATIVPDGADLAVEFRLALNDIDQINVGQEARLRFSAFNQRVTPEATGKVIRVGAAAQTDGNGQSYYLAQIELPEMPAGLSSLVPGMPVEVFVETEKQVAIAYLLKPFTDQVHRAMREE